jgi:hypothetical protein
MNPYNEISSTSYELGMKGDKPPTHEDNDHFAMERKLQSKIK